MLTSSTGITSRLIKSPHKASGTPKYHLVQEDIRDVPAQAVTPLPSLNDDPSEERQQAYHCK
jgi:hypothetical protein